MAWIDDRIWCHPKITDVSPLARWTWVASIAYSAGLQTSGVLSAGQQTLIGSNAKVRRELVAAQLWEDVDGVAIQIHDWADHNSKRDEQRAQARDRKRKQRDKGRDSHAPVTRDIGVTNGVTSRGGGRASREGSEGSEQAKAVRKTSSSAHSESLTAQPFVAFLVNESNRVGVPLPPRSKGQAAKLLADLVVAGASDEVLRTGITRMVEHGRPISALTDIVREVAAAPAAEPEVDYPPLPPVAYDWVEPQ